MQAYFELLKLQHRLDQAFGGVGSGANIDGAVHLNLIEDVLPDAKPKDFRQFVDYLFPNAGVSGTVGICQAGRGWSCENFIAGVGKQACKALSAPTLVVEANTCRSSLASIFAVPTRPGLRQALESLVPAHGTIGEPIKASIVDRIMTRCIHRTAFEHLYVMPSGNGFGNRWGSLTCHIRTLGKIAMSRFRNVIIALPSPRSHTFPYSALESIFLLVKFGHTTVGEVQQSVQLLIQAGARLSGTILTDELIFGAQKRGQYFWGH
jgi:hypothetical protein